MNSMFIIMAGQCESSLYGIAIKDWFGWCRTLYISDSHNWLTFLAFLLSHSLLQRTQANAFVFWSIEAVLRVLAEF